MTGPELADLCAWIAERRKGLGMFAEGWGYSPKIRMPLYYPDGSEVADGTPYPEAFARGAVARPTADLVKGEPRPDGAALLAAFDVALERCARIDGLVRLRREWESRFALGAQWVPSVKTLRDATLAWADDLAYEILGGSEECSAYEALAALSGKRIAAVREVLEHRGTLRMLAEEYRRHTAHEVVGVLFGVSQSTVRDVHLARKAR